MIANLNHHATLYPGRRTRTIAAGVLGDVNGIKVAIATAVIPATYSGATLDGVLANPGPAELVVPMLISVTTGASPATYNTTDPITISGTSFSGDLLTEGLLLTQAGGGETVTTEEAFATVTQIDVPAQLGAGGQFEFGSGNAAFDEPPRLVRAGMVGNLVLIDDLDVVDTIPCQLAEKHDVFVHEIDSSSTCFPITVYL